MKIELLFFGISSDLVGKNSMDFKLAQNASVKSLKVALITDYSALKNIADFAIAVNEEYAEDELILKENDVVAIIPPVSGG